MADKPKIDFSRLEEYSRQSSTNEPIAMVVQCHKCHKRLKYNGLKPYITCPGCGESVPVPDNIHEDEPVLLPPPVQSTSQSNLSQRSNVTAKQFDFAKWDAIAKQYVTNVKAMPRFPVVLSGIWIVWVAIGFFLFSIGMVNYQELNSAGVIGYGRYYSYSDWFILHVGDSVYMSIWTTSFPAIVLSAIAYFWIVAIEKSK